MTDISNDTKIGMLSTRIDDIDRRCKRKEQIIDDIKDNILPDAIDRIVDHSIDPILQRLRVIEGWNKYATGYAALFGLVAMFVANKLWS